MPRKKVLALAVPDQPIAEYSNSRGTTYIYANGIERYVPVDPIVPARRRKPKVKKGFATLHVHKPGEPCNIDCREAPYGPLPHLGADR